MQEQAIAERTESLLWIMLSVLMHRCTAGPQHISQIGRQGYGNQWRLPLHGESGAELARVAGWRCGTWLTDAGGRRSW